MIGYLKAGAAGAVVGAVLLAAREGGSTGDGLSPRDIAGGGLDIGFYVVVFLAGWAIRNRFSR